MIFTLYYAYATMIQWWRLRNLRNKLRDTLSSQNALLICTGDTINDNRRHRCLENLLYRSENRIVCTIVPKQKLNLAQWLAFPRNLRHFPIYFVQNSPILDPHRRVYVLLQAMLENYVKHQSDLVQVENFGELVGWKALDHFEMILRTDLNGLTKLVQQFSQNDVDINHELKLLKIETVDVEGVATYIKYEKKYLKEQTIKYSYAPVHWSKFVQEIKELYIKIRDITTPKIKIENGTSAPPPNKAPKTKETDKKHASTGTKPAKTKESSKKTIEKNKLDVKSSTTSEHRRHKLKKTAHKDDKTSSHHKDDIQTLHKDDKPSTSRVQRHRKKSTNEQDAKKLPEKTKKLIKQKSSIQNDDEPMCKMAAIKPPNVLVYADTPRTQDTVKRMLFSILNKEKYTIYDLPASKQAAWDQSTVLVVVCGNVAPDLTTHLIQFLLNGGQLLCLCSDLMYSVLHTFTTAEVREHELVRFSYNQWQNIQMMHHIFCYQASPAKKQFSKDLSSDHSSSNGSSPLAPRTPSIVDLKYNEKTYQVAVEVLGTEETWHTPSLLLANVKNGGGRAVFSQVHLEIDPEQFGEEGETYDALRDSNGARMEILRDVIERHLELECDEGAKTVEYAPGFFLGRYDDKMALITNCEAISNNQLICEKIQVNFCGHNVEPGPATNIRFPVLIHSCPADFSTLQYFETLNTEFLGRLVIYADILTSSHHLLPKKLRHGLVVIAKQQTNGVGRSKNTWLSPIGSAAFSLQMHIELDTTIGRVLPLIQHLVMVAIVEAIKKEGYNINLGVKWPNDLYANNTTKIGGMMVTTLIVGKQAIVNIGAGVNLSNRNPTICINDLIGESNAKNGLNQPELGYEKYFAIVFNEIERLYNRVQENGVDELLKLYYRDWLHSGANVSVQNEQGDVQEARIIGIDDYGFLSVKLANGKLISVQPDGNSFDIMRGLIAPKSF